MRDTLQRWTELWPAMQQQALSELVRYYVDLQHAFGFHAHDKAALQHLAQLQFEHLPAFIHALRLSASAAPSSRVLADLNLRWQTIDDHLQRNGLHDLADFQPRLRALGADETAQASLAEQSFRLMAAIDQTLQQRLSAQRMRLVREWWHRLGLGAIGVLVLMTGLGLTVAGALRREARRQQALNFSRIFDASPEALAVVDLQTLHCVSINHAFEGLFGYLRDEICTVSLPDLLS
jgi:hypothetical protein